LGRSEEVGPRWGRRPVMAFVAAVVGARR
jgi:hypothetical protein